MHSIYWLLNAHDKQKANRSDLECELRMTLPDCECTQADQDIRSFHMPQYAHDAFHISVTLLVMLSGLGSFMAH